MQRNNTFVKAALGSKHANKHDEEKFEIPQLKFPSEHEEEESIKLFRRCGGPLAASYAGRMKLVQDEKHFYGDGRPLSFCRVSGCQMVHSESQMVSYLHLISLSSLHVQTTNYFRSWPFRLLRDTCVTGIMQ